MKIIYLIIILIWFTGCDPENEFTSPEDQSQYKAILMNRVDLESSISFQPSRDLINPGKIYLKDFFIYINEKYEGFHVINNSNPRDPVNIGFLVVPGAIDVAIKDNILYADNAVDLVAINIADLDSAQVVSRNNEVFPELLPPDLMFLPNIYTAENRPANSIIVKWVRKQ